MTIQSRLFRWLLPLGMALSMGMVLGMVLHGDTALASPTIHYVAPGGNCNSASPCYASIQDAVDAAIADDEIFIAAGLYTGINNKGGLAQVVYIDKSVTLRGGYTPSDWNTPNPDVNITEINALAQGRVMVITGTVDVTLDGLRLTYGDGSGLGGLDHSEIGIPKDVGGGLFVHEANLTLRSTHILSSTITDGLGGGVALVRSQAAFQDCTIEGNNADSGGGGVGIINSGVWILRCQVNYNSGGTFQPYSVKAFERYRYGATYSTQVEISDSTINGNDSGGAYFDSVSAVTITYSTVSNNDGNGIRIFSPGKASIRANTFQENQGRGIYTSGQNLVIEDNLIADNYGGGVEIEFGAPVFRRNVVRGNSLGYAWGSGVYFQCSNSADTIFTDNIIVNNHISIGIMSLGSGGGLHLSGCDGVTLERNWILNNRTYAVE